MADAGSCELVPLSVSRATIAWFLSQASRSAAESDAGSNWVVVLLSSPGGGTEPERPRVSRAMFAWFLSRAAFSAADSVDGSNCAPEAPCALLAGSPVFPCLTAPLFKGAIS
jgi:hypothetical protein